MTALRKWDEPRPVKLTTDDFRKLAEAGAFRDYAKTELIDGVIVAMNAQFSAHARAKSLLLRRLAEAVEAAMPGYEAWSEVSVAIPPGNMPEPDLVVTRFRGGREPVPADTVAMVVEVADTTAGYDLGAKAAVYAAAGIGEYWVVDIEVGRIHQLAGPDGRAYGRRLQTEIGARIEALTLPGVAVETTGLAPPPD